MKQVFKNIAGGLRALGPLILITVIIGVWETTRLLEFSSKSHRQGTSVSNQQGPSDQQAETDGWKHLEDEGLIDSILAIVQGYYVDEGRVSNESILIDTLKVLQENGKITLGRSRSSVLEVTAGARKIELEMKSPFPYLDLLSSMSRIAALVDESRNYTHSIKTKALKESDNKPEKSWKRTGSIIVLNALLSSLDAHSSLLSPQSYTELRQGTEGAFGGLGVLVGIRNHLLTVIKPLPQSPAIKAGITKNDRILSINGVSTFGRSLDSLVEHMRGDPGTTVDLRLLRKDSIGPQKIEINREVINVTSVETKSVSTVDGGPVPHIAIDSFSSRTATELYSALQKVRRQYGRPLKGLVLDLRSNPGGLLDQSVHVADLFLKRGVIVTTSGRRNEVEKADIGFDEVDYPMVVLVDGESASASEIVAGALQDHERALIIGQPSFGKGSVQTIFELPGEQALKLTIARYYTPSGRSIQNVGITPDVWVQPIRKTKSNVNLLGIYRYQNEAFLKHRLEIAAEIRKKNRSHALMKGYYLRESELEEVADPKDVEYNLAMSVIKNVVKIHPNGLDSSNNRATQWLALASSDLNKTLKNKKTELDQYLAKEFSLDWGPSKTQWRAGYPVTIALQKPLGKTKAGSHIKVPIRITNNGVKAISRVSIFLRSDNPMIDSREILIGKIPARTALKKIVEFYVPSYIPAGKLKIQGGFAVEASAQSSGRFSSTLEVLPSSNLEILADFELENEEGGNVQGRLESKEIGEVVLYLRNHSSIAVHNLQVSVQNLSGLQVKILDKKKNIKLMRAGEVLPLRFKVVGSQSIVSEGLLFGATILSETDGYLNRLTGSISSLPNATKDIQAQKLSH